MYKYVDGSHLSGRSRLAVMVALLTVVKCIVGSKQAESYRHCVSLRWLAFCLYSFYFNPCRCKTAHEHTCIIFSSFETRDTIITEKFNTAQGLWHPVCIHWTGITELMVTEVEVKWQSVDVLHVRPLQSTSRREL